MMGKIGSTFAASDAHATDAPSPPAASLARRLFRRGQRIVRSLPARFAHSRDRAQALSMIARFPTVSMRSAHGLPGPLIVSLTSYPARYPTLPNTLKSLLDQTVRPDRTVLWIAHEDEAALTPEILMLREHGLEIRLCKDLKVYNKIIHSLERWPEAFIVTADDDIYYPPDWLASITDHYDPTNPMIVCRRAHRPQRDARGELRPYQEWEWQVSDNRPSKTDLFPTGTGGVLYYPGALAPEVIDHASLTTLCAHCDDIWLWWMGRRSGVIYQQVGGYFRTVEWAGSQATSLFSGNSRGRNDERIRAMRAHFGPV